MRTLGYYIYFKSITKLNSHSDMESKKITAFYKPPSVDLFHQYIDTSSFPVARQTEKFDPEPIPHYSLKLIYPKPQLK
ncbi:hypothetical protein AS29_009260 [Bacillus sp. SJS]|nr:hypothetical protein AS29_009260 [Bacillus sp. SJS]